MLRTHSCSTLENKSVIPWVADLTWRQTPKAMLYILRTHSHSTLENKSIRPWIADLTWRQTPKAMLYILITHSHSTFENNSILPRIAKLMWRQTSKAVLYIFRTHSYSTLENKSVLPWVSLTSNFKGSAIHLENSQPLHTWQQIKDECAIKTRCMGNIWRNHFCFFASVFRLFSESQLCGDSQEITAWDGLCATRKR